MLLRNLRELNATEKISMSIFVVDRKNKKNIVKSGKDVEKFS